MLDRRTLLKAGASTFAICLPLSRSVAQTAAIHGRVQIFPQRVLNEIPISYNGFSIETATLENPNIYSADNHSLVALFRRLTQSGVLRIGGNSSEFCWWKASSENAPPQIKAAGQGRSDNWMPQRLHPVTPNAIDHLRNFLDATGWTCIYGLNFGTGTPARDAEEAEYVARVLGPKLRYFQIGNEPDFYRDPNNLLRPAGWDFPDYQREWLAIAHAVIERVPNAKFGGPDVGSSADWVIRFGNEVAKNLGDRVQELTGHYYAEGPPDSPSASIENLLAEDPRIAERMSAIIPVAKRNGLTFRMAEGNSCYRGGKAGMSNALAGALWGMDYMLDMAARGCKGINLHGGGGSEISSALGDKLPGARDARDLEIAKLGTFYSPVAGNPVVGYSARPIFYGMMAVEQFAGSTLVACELDNHDVNARVYAAHRNGKWRVALINKDLEHDMTIEVAVPDTSAAASVWRLSAPRVDATEGVTLAGSQIMGADAQWTTTKVERVMVKQRSVSLNLPRASAAVLLFE
ncbi:MAG: hypothetical protein ACJ8MR_09875 [Povalibacter sp.]